MDLTKTETGNIAQAFMDIGSINQTVSYDGSLSFGPANLKEEEEADAELYIRRSVDQSGFYEIDDPSNMPEEGSFEELLYDTFDKIDFLHLFDRLPKGEVVINKDGEIEVNGWEYYW